MLLFLFGSQVPLSVPFCVHCSPCHPSCLSLSLGIPHLLPLCISVSDNRISFLLCSHRFFADCQNSINGTSLPLALSRGLKNFCLISSMQELTELSMFPTQTRQRGQGRAANEPIKVSSPANITLVLQPKCSNSCSFKNSMLSSIDRNVPKC